jgi:hypothetical protein
MQLKHNMKCKEINKNLIGYIEDTIPANLRVDIEKHFSQCITCKELYENVFATYTICNHQPQVEVNPYFHTRLEQKLKNKAQASIKSSSGKLVWRLQPIAAGLLIVIGVSAGIFIGNSLSGTSIAGTKPNRTELLEAYANDYYLTDNNDESINALINNE